MLFGADERNPPVGDLELASPEITLCQEWITTSEAAALAGYLGNARLSEATVRRRCRESTTGKVGQIRITRKDGGYLVNLPDMLADHRQALEQFTRRLGEIEEIRRRCFETRH